MNGSLVILDRDGVINEDSAEFIKSPDEWRPIRGSLAAIAELNGAGFTVAIASNQSGLARGLFDKATLQAIHAKLLDAVETKGGRIAELVYCPHGPNDACECRKPLPGLLQMVAKRLGFSPEQCIMIGDSARDLEAAEAFGARPILVRTGKGRVTEMKLQARDGLEVYDDLAAAARQLIAERQAPDEREPEPR